MKQITKSFLFTLIILSLFIGGTDRAFAQKTARASALIDTPVEKKIDNRAIVLRKFLEQYDSPLVGSTETFITEADKYNLDWRFVVAIAGVESWFGQRIPQNSYNAWGWGVYGGNVHRFTSWDEGIMIISESLRTKYMDKWGARNVAEIGSFYAADPHWAVKVTNFMNKISAFEEAEKRTTLSISL